MDDEDLTDLSESTLQKKLKKINEEIFFLNAENRLFSNYLRWYETRMMSVDEANPRLSPSKIIPEMTKIDLQSSDEIHRTSKASTSLLSTRKKREIAETVCKVLLGYAQKLSHRLIDYIDQCNDTLETDDETMVHFDLELTILKKFSQKVLRDHPKVFTVDELAEFFRDRIRYREALEERKRQKSVRLRFHLENVEKSLRKIRQIVDTISEVDYEQIQIDIEKQAKELKKKTQMLIFYKRQQSEANVQLNTQKPNLFRVLRSFASIRQTIEHRMKQIRHYDQIKQKMEHEIIECEKINEPLRLLMTNTRVPSINDYVHLKSKQINLHRQTQAWIRKVEIVQREYHLRQIEAQHHPEQVIHPWKSLQNPSPILFHRQCLTSTQMKMKFPRTFD